MRQVPAGGGLLAQHLGSGAICDKIPVDFGRIRMSWRGDKAVLVSWAELGMGCSVWVPLTAPGMDIPSLSL